MPLSYEQAKDQISIKIYNTRFAFLAQKYERNCLEKAAELYADSVARDAWDRACKAQFDSLQSQFLIPDVFKDNDYRKPEYQPK